MLLFFGFLIGLPLSVWLLAAVCAVFDEPKPMPALIRLIGFVCAILLLLLITDRAFIYPVGAALVIVTLLHLLGFWAIRHFALTVPVFQRQPVPPVTDALADAEDSATRQDQ